MICFLHTALSVTAGRPGCHTIAMKFLAQNLEQNNAENKPFATDVSAAGKSGGDMPMQLRKKPTPNDTLTTCNITQCIGHALVYLLT